jgi:hypothetical protein
MRTVDWSYDRVPDDRRIRRGGHHEARRILLQMVAAVAQMRGEMDDDELIAAAADGDDAALRELLYRYAPWPPARLRAVRSVADVADVPQNGSVGPAGLLAELVVAAELYRPVVIDSASAAAAVRPYSWLLGRIGDKGVELTPAGYLPPAMVTEAMTALGWQAGWAGAQRREHLCTPVLELRQSARRMRLVRTRRGVLLRTALGGRLRADPGRLWWHIAGCLPYARDGAGRDAGHLLLLAVAAAAALDPQAIRDLLRRGMAAPGW